MRLSALTMFAICGFGYLMGLHGHGPKSPEFYVAMAFMLIFITLGYAKGWVAGHRNGRASDTLTRRGSRSHV